MNLARTAIIEQTNAHRRGYGLNPYKRSSTLDAYAQAYANRIARGEIPYGHSGINVYENLHRVDDPTDAYKGCVAGWKNSPGHNRNMLQSGAYYQGIGLAKMTTEDHWLCVAMYSAEDGVM